MELILKLGKIKNESIEGIKKELLQCVKDKKGVPNNEYIKDVINESVKEPALAKTINEFNLVDGFWDKEYYKSALVVPPSSAEPQAQTPPN